MRLCPIRHHPSHVLQHVHERADRLYCVELDTVHIGVLAQDLEDDERDGMEPLDGS